MMEDRSSASQQAGHQSLTDSRAREWIEVLTVLLMGLATIASAWSGYQASQWGDVQSQHSGKANERRTESVKASLRASQQQLLDTQIYTEWIEALDEGKKERAEHYLMGMTPSARAAALAWLALTPFENPRDAPLSPLGMEEYKLEESERAIQVRAEADRFSEQSRGASQQSSQYAFNTVLLATATFFAGLATRFRRLWIQAVLTSLSVAMLGYGLYHIAAYPIA